METLIAPVTKPEIRVVQPRETPIPYPREYSAFRCPFCACYHGTRPCS